MSTIYYIGGAPRSGKSFVIQELITRKPMFAASTDAIRSAAKGVLKPNDNPKFFKTERGEFGSEKHISIMKNDPDLALEYEVGEAEETWKSTQDFISYYQRDGKDAAIEGVGVLPKYLPDLEYQFNAVFIVNLSDQTEVMLKHAKNHPEDWLNKYSEETIRLFSSFNQLWNKYYAEQAKKYNQPLIEIDSNDFQTSISKAVDELLR